jgi:hypothetical protein
MTGLTDYITECRWEHVFITWYVLVDDAYQAIRRRTGRLRQRGPEPHFSDSEVITIALITETFFHGNEELCMAFIRQYHADLFPRLLDDTRFNRRRRALLGMIEAIRRQLTTLLIDPQDRTRLIDSAPIPLCTYMRGPKCATVAGAEYCGVMVSRRAKLFGMRLYLTTTTEQVVDQWMLAPASHRDGKMTPALFEDACNLWVLGDNAFHDPTSADWLRRQRNIVLIGMQRRDAKKRWPKALRRFLNRIRRRVETALSVLCTVFNLERPGSRSVSGLLTRIATRLLAYNLSFLTCAILSSSPN